MKHKKEMKSVFDMMMYRERKKIHFGQHETVIKIQTFHHSDKNFFVTTEKTDSE